MALYVTRCLLSVNGTDIDNFKAVTEKARIPRKAVPLMYKTGAAELTERFEVDVEYVVPRDTTEFDFTSVSGGTLTIEYDSGTQTRFGGVHCKEVGDAKIDGEAELVKVISFICETRNGNTGATA